MNLRDVFAATDTEEPWEDVVAQVLEEEGREVSEQAVRERIQRVRADALETVAIARFDPGAFDDSVVISAEEVAAYWTTLPVGTDMIDVLDVLAPPHDRLFVEFQHQPNRREISLNSWGVMIEGVRLQGEAAIGAETPALATEGWILKASLVCEFRKGEPVGPMAVWVIPLDQHGRPDRGDDEGHGSVFMRPIQFEGGSPYGDVPPERVFEFANELGASHLGPALLAISLMHCKNVDIRPVDPPERLSRNHARRNGRPLTRYYVLDVQPMRRVLDREGGAQANGLREALHICRGHFKTFSEDSPLFGKHTGTYWWESQVRGKAEHGVVEKDYRIRLDQGLGREYVEADEQPEISPSAPEHVGLDPDLGGRGLKAHNVTQNQVAAAVREAGYEPRRPKPDEPQFDLAWEVGDVTWVAEVKSVTPQNETRQMRHGLGQVLHYRHLLAADGRTVKAAIATEREPSDPTWAGLLSEEDVLLVWPGSTDGLFSQRPST